MTIYSQHPSRGKVQILATYREPGGVRSSTVTSVADATLALPIVDALNRISACATVPVSVWETEGDGTVCLSEQTAELRDCHEEYLAASYPQEHVAALTDQTARADLLEGAHSLWYEQVKVLLYHALSDLDDAVAAVPAPVQQAIAAELESEAHGLRDALAEDPDEEPDVCVLQPENRRLCDFGSPLVAIADGFDGLSDETRDRLNRLERDATTEQIRTAATDLRLLLDADRKCANHELTFLDDFTITVDHWPYRGHYLNVDAPLPRRDPGRDEWRVEIGRWIEESGDSGEENSSARGEPILRCVQPAPPAVEEIVDLLNRSAERPEHLAAWATTPVGEMLSGTTFAVTERCEE
ncbi:hypothetical protein JOF56_009376 [Kibdelosporangium banguiense]|uniref:Uncharacterized protein n=1 Tax=Kibdelosporangium banguiense TaxID=1365924 RepID=A0ABS4TYH3_9PSEU|nr:hypothetical protein [Kibdelosporangium banguiense]MBP2328991.1 hypothetical protein [Kibdelosporangium banguiense]